MHPPPTLNDKQVLPNGKWMESGRMAKGHAHTGDVRREYGIHSGDGIMNFSCASDSVGTRFTVGKCMSQVSSVNSAAPRGWGIALYCNAPRARAAPSLSNSVKVTRAPHWNAGMHWEAWFGRVDRLEFSLAGPVARPTGPGQGQSELTYRRGKKRLLIHWGERKPSRIYFWIHNQSLDVSNVINELLLEPIVNELLLEQ